MRRFEHRELVCPFSAIALQRSTHIAAQGARGACCAHAKPPRCGRERDAAHLPGSAQVEPWCRRRRRCLSVWQAGPNHAFERTRGSVIALRLTSCFSWHRERAAQRHRWALRMVTPGNMQGPTVRCKRPSQPPVPIALHGRRGAGSSVLFSRSVLFRPPRAACPHAALRCFKHHRPAEARARAADALCFSQERVARHRALGGRGFRGLRSDLFLSQTSVRMATPISVLSSASAHAAIAVLSSTGAVPSAAPNPRFERTRYGGLRPPARAAQPKRWALRHGHARTHPPLVREVLAFARSRPCPPSCPGVATRALPCRRQRLRSAARATPRECSKSRAAFQEVAAVGLGARSASAP